MPLLKQHYDSLAMLAAVRGADMQTKAPDVDSEHADVAILPKQV